MNVANFTDLISTVGFPIACVIAMAAFIAYMVKKTTEQHNKDMKELQEVCLAREEKLFNEIKETREINAKAVTTIAMYSEKLEVIQKDVTDIKTDIIMLTAKAE